MKKHSWISYLSVGNPIVLFVLMFLVSNITQQPVVKIIFIALFIGAPFSIILSTIAIFKKNEKNMIAFLGLLTSLLLTGSIVYLLILGLGMGEA